MPRSRRLAHTYDGGVGNSRAEREEPLARTAYVAAARRFVTAFSAVLASGVPIDPGRPPDKAPGWTAAHIAALRELHAALGANPSLESTPPHSVPPPITQRLNGIVVTAATDADRWVGGDPSGDSDRRVRASVSGDEDREGTDHGEDGADDAYGEEGEGEALVAPIRRLAAA
jgi:hypothetical protein